MRILVKWDGLQIVDKNDEEFHFSPICFRPLVQKTTNSSKGSVRNPAHTNMCVKATTARSNPVDLTVRYEMMKLCALGQCRTAMQWLVLGGTESV